jgi:hypothetical protein
MLFVLTLLMSHSSSILNKRHDGYRHTYKIQQKKNACVQRPENRWIFFFFFFLSNVALYTISFSFFFSFAFFFLDSKINFPSSSSTDAPCCCYFFLFSYIYFFAIPTCLNAFLGGSKGKKREKTKKIFFCQQILFSFIRISISNCHLRT